MRRLAICALLGLLSPCSGPCAVDSGNAGDLAGDSAGFGVGRGRASADEGADRAVDKDAGEDGESGLWRLDVVDVVEGPDGGWLVRLVNLSPQTVVLEGAASWEFVIPTQGGKRVSVLKGGVVHGRYVAEGGGSVDGAVRLFVPTLGGYGHNLDDAVLVVEICETVSVGRCVPRIRVRGER